VPEGLYENSIRAPRAPASTLHLAVFAGGRLILDVLFLGSAHLLFFDSPGFLVFGVGGGCAGQKLLNLFADLVAGWPLVIASLGFLFFCFVLI
jgi:hypothetical protein